MPHHNESITCVAAEDINLYATVKTVVADPANDVHGIPLVEMTGAATDIILGVAFEEVKAGELVTVRLPFSGLLPAFCYTSPKPGQGLTIGQATPGSLSNNPDPIYARRIGYVVQVGPSVGFSSNISKCFVAFTRAYYI